MCTEWAKLRASSRVRGRAVNIQDAWIAASALDLKAPLATNSRNDFEHIKGFDCCSDSRGSEFRLTRSQPAA
jgi:predicted nucleic acid-binding protein